MGEIGVHHGRFLILLHLLLQEGERSFAIDLFDRQDENIDKSGKGDMQRFLENLKACTDDPERCVIIAENSLHIQPQRIMSEVGKVRLLSVDGGHYEEAVASDLRLAQACLVGGGVAIVDDFFNHDWPGVAAGTSAFLLDKECALFPFMAGPNKLYLTNDESLARRFRDDIRAACCQTFVAEHRMMGHPVAAFNSDWLDTRYWTRQILSRSVPRPIRKALRHVLNTASRIADGVRGR